MELLKRGKRYKYKCKHCDSWFDFGKEDIMTEQIKDGFFKTHTEEFTQCPVCARSVKGTELAKALCGEFEDIYKKEIRA